MSAGGDDMSAARDDMAHAHLVDMRKPNDLRMSMPEDLRVPDDLRTPNDLHAAAARSLRPRSHAAVHAHLRRRQLRLGQLRRHLPVFDRHLFQRHHLLARVQRRRLRHDHRRHDVERADHVARPAAHHGGPKLKKKPNGTRFSAEARCRSSARLWRTSGTAKSMFIVVCDTPNQSAKMRMV